MTVVLVQSVKVNGLPDVRKIKGLIEESITALKENEEEEDDENGKKGIIFSLRRQVLHYGPFYVNLQEIRRG